MKKTILATALTAATASTSALAMDPASDLAARLDSMPSLYGNIQLAYFHQDVDNGTRVTDNSFGDNGSTIGVSHEHEMAPGLVGFFKAELEFLAGEGKGSNNGLRKIDEAYIGMKGAFGSIQFGSDDTVYEAGNVIDISEALGSLSLDLPQATQDRLPNLDSSVEAKNLQYYSPEMGGLQFGVTLPLQSRDKASRFQALGKYAMNNIEAGVMYSVGGESNGYEMGDSVGAFAVVQLADLTLQAQYETKDSDSFATTGDIVGSEVDGWALQGIYAMGPNQFALGYQFTETDLNEETGTVFVQALHNLSDNMYAYVEAATGTNEAPNVTDEDVDALAIGMTYAF